MEYLHQKGMTVNAYQFAGGSTEPGWPDDFPSCYLGISEDGNEFYIESGVGGGSMDGRKGDWLVKLENRDFTIISDGQFRKEFKKAA